MSMKNSNETIGNRSRDLPVCSAVPQPLRHQQRAPWHWYSTSPTQRNTKRLERLMKGCIILDWTQKTWRINVSTGMPPASTGNKFKDLPRLRETVDNTGSYIRGKSKIFRTDAVQIIQIINKRLWKLPTSTQLRATWHTDSLDMVVLSSTGASR
jgi:hypothetical protein